MRHLFTITRLLCVVGLVTAGGCDGSPPRTDAGDADSGRVEDSGQPPEDTGPPPGDCEGPPGLYVEGSCTVLAAGVQPYHPRFVLWTDGAVKDRFIYLPPGTQIDTSNPDHWVFPVGTRLFKTFSLGGMRLETRILLKERIGTGRTAWDMRTYAWNAAQDRVTDVTNATLGIRENVLGTNHDIPSGAQCQECHWATLDVVNSFSAIQINHAEDGLTLEGLRSAGWMTNDIAPAMAEIPGDATAVAALGYLHANCGNCHRTTPPGTACQTPACRTGLHMWIDVGTATVEQTSTYLTAVGVRSSFSDRSAPNAVCRIHPADGGSPGDPALSTIVFRMSSRGDGAQMPPIGSEITHPDGIDSVSAWVRAVSGDTTDCTR